MVAVRGDKRKGKEGKLRGEVGGKIREGIRGEGTRRNV